MSRALTIGMRIKEVHPKFQLSLQKFFSVRVPHTLRTPIVPARDSDESEAFVHSR